jgi:hypothetical protein
VSPVHCAESDIPVHEHHVGLLWMRTTPRVSVGLGEGWQLSAELPFDLRWTDVLYTLPDGTPYTPPYTSIHHRNEWIDGLVDAKVSVGRVGRWPGGWILSGQLGTTIPFGQTEENPYALTAEGKVHQHFQLGSGTFQPTLSFALIKAADVWRLFGSGNARLSLYENDKAYRAASVYGLEGGASREFGERLDASLALNASATTSNFWSGEPYPGLQSLNAKVGLITHLGLNWSLETQALLLIADRVVGEQGGEVASQRTSFTLGLSWIN